MKKFFKFLGIIILLAVVFLLVAGLFIPRDYHYERSTTIKAPKEIIWNNLSYFSNFEKWNPWKVLDPAMTSKIEGTDGTVGAVYSWQGNKDVGKGSMTYTAIHPYDSIGVALRFIEPFESNAQSFYLMKEEAQGYKVTWGFNSKMPYPFNAVCYFFLDMESNFDKDFSTGLNNLKKLSESSATMTAMK